MFEKYQKKLSEASMSVGKFFALTAYEENLKTEIENLISDSLNNNDCSAEAKLIRVIKNPTLQMKSLIKITEKIPALFDFLQHDRLQDLFKECWRLYGANPSSPDSQNPADCHDMLPQIAVSSVSLLFGYFYYQQALRVRKVTSMQYTLPELIYLRKAESYKSFHAMNALNKFDLKHLKLFEHKRENYPYIDDLLRRAKLAADIHGTPGYLMLVDTYYSIAEYNNTLGKTEAVTSALILCLQNLNLAKRKMAESQTAINNAYLGRGLSASNAYGFENLTDLRNFIIKNAGRYLEIDDIKYADGVNGFNDASVISPRPF